KPGSLCHRALRGGSVLDGRWALGLARTLRGGTGASRGKGKVLLRARTATRQPRCRHKRRNRQKGRSESCKHNPGSLRGRGGSPEGPAGSAKIETPDPRQGR